MIRHSLSFLLALALIGVASHTNALQPFGPDSADEIDTRYADETALLLVWSLGCHYCKEGMVRAGELRQAHPELNLILLNIDPPQDAAEVVQALAEMGLSDADNWQFGDGPPARLRATLDPTWYGELPRNYLLAPGEGRQGFSGRLTGEVLEYWVERSGARFGL
jgi:thiol-disulfide isomerase/thioredoxin